MIGLVARKKGFPLNYTDMEISLLNILKPVPVSDSGPVISKWFKAQVCVPKSWPQSQLIRERINELNETGPDFQEGILLFWCERKVVNDHISWFSICFRQFLWIFVRLVWAELFFSSFCLTYCIINNRSEFFVYHNGEMTGSSFRPRLRSKRQAASVKCRHKVSRKSKLNGKFLSYLT